MHAFSLLLLHAVPLLQSCAAEFFFKNEHLTSNCSKITIDRPSNCSNWIKSVFSDELNSRETAGLFVWINSWTVPQDSWAPAYLVF